MKAPIRWAALGLLGIGVTLSAQYSTRNLWMEPDTAEMPEFDQFENSEGKLGVLNAAGKVKTEGHPFFTPLGTNGRACINCHQPAWGMSVSVDGLQARWKQTQGSDPVFATFDGADCPDRPQGQPGSHNLLLNRGLFRIPLAWPPKNADGSAKPVEFSIEVVHDPTGCNRSTEYGLNSANPTISVYRRPRPAANLQYVTQGGTALIAKTGEVADRDPLTGQPVAMNLMSDAREATLTTQALSAVMGHEQATQPPSAADLERIVAFESQIYVAQATHVWAGELMGFKNIPSGLGPVNLRDRLLAKPEGPVFGSFAGWKDAGYYQSSIARGSEIFTKRPFWIRDAAHANSAGMGNPAKGTCASCHSGRMVGQDAQAGWIDVGTTTFPTWTESATAVDNGDLPVFKITCSKDAKPHPYLGRTIYTTDPGRAMISGKCEDVGSIVMQQLRGLAGRAPYFANGAAGTLREVVDYYDRRFDMKLTEREKDDLINFLGVL